MINFRKAVMTPKMLQKINENVWIKDEALCYELELDSVDNPYQIFETIFVNVSASIGKHWKDVYKSNSHNSESYICLCVCAILIDRWLKKRYKLLPEERLHLLGARLSEIVYKYKNSLTTIR